jgi:hypothetical protein
MQMERSSTHSAATTVSLWFWGWKSQYPRATTWHSCSSGTFSWGTRGRIGRILRPFSGTEHNRNLRRPPAAAVVPKNEHPLSFAPMLLLSTPSLLTPSTLIFLALNLSPANAQC